MAEAIAVLKRAGRRRRRSRRHPERRRPGSAAATSCCGTSARAPTTRRGSDADCSIVVQVRHEARLQHLAGVARPVGAGEDADRAARRGTPRTRTRARSSTASRTSTSRTRWTWRRDRARYEADRAKDIRLSATHGIDEVMKAQRLDALLFPAAAAPRIAARPGYPTVIVPFGVRAEHPDAAPAGRFQPETLAIRRGLHGPRLQRAEADRDRVRVRTGH